jgi:hypothetical protein
LLRILRSIWGDGILNWSKRFISAGIQQTNWIRMIQKWATFYPLTVGLVQFGSAVDRRHFPPLVHCLGLELGLQQPQRSHLIRIHLRDLDDKASSTCWFSIGFLCPKIHMSYDVLWCLMMSYDVLWCLMMSYVHDIGYAYVIYMYLACRMYMYNIV